MTKITPEEMEEIFQDIVARGLAVDTGQKRWGPISKRMQTVYRLADGVTYEEFCAAYYGGKGEA